MFKFKSKFIPLDSDLFHFRTFFRKTKSFSPRKRLGLDKNDVLNEYDGHSLSIFAVVL